MTFPNRNLFLRQQHELYKLYNALTFMNKRGFISSIVILVLAVLIGMAIFLINKSAKSEEVEKKGEENKLRLIDNSNVAENEAEIVYPGSNIEKCDASEPSKIFDACKGLSKDESYSFIFNEKGNWDYHDNLNSNLKGTLTVV